MSAAGKAARLFQPWAGLVAGVAGAAVAHQFGADGTFDHCATISPVPLILVSSACMVAAALGALASAKVARGHDEGPTRRLVAFISIGMAALAVFAVILPMIASLILPPCFQ